MGGEIKPKELGVCAGEQCGRNDCTGILEDHPVENCSCHINPPCGACIKDRTYCPVCQWEAQDE